MQLKTFDEVLKHLFSDCDFYISHFKKLIKEEKMSDLLKVYVHDSEITSSAEGYITIISDFYEEPSNRTLFMSSLINMNRALLSSYK